MSHPHCKVVALGDRQKSLLLKTFASGVVQEEERAAFAQNFAKQVQIDSVNVILNVYDTAGEEEYFYIRRTAYHLTDVFIICFSLLNLHSLHKVPLIAKEVVGAVKNPVILLVGTQTAEREESEAYESKEFITHEEGLGLSEAIGAAKYFEVSVRDIEAVNAVFEEAARIKIHVPRLKALQQERALMSEKIQAAQQAYERRLREVQAQHREKKISKPVAKAEEPVSHAAESVSEPVREENIEALVIHKQPTVEEALQEMGFGKSAILAAMAMQPSGTVEEILEILTTATIPYDVQVQEERSPVSESEASAVPYSPVVQKTAAAAVYVAHERVQPPEQPFPESTYPTSVLDRSELFEPLDASSRSAPSSAELKHVPLVLSLSPSTLKQQTLKPPVSPVALPTVPRAKQPFAKPSVPPTSLAFTALVEFQDRKKIIQFSKQETENVQMMIRIIWNAFGVTSNLQSRYFVEYYDELFKEYIDLDSVENVPTFKPRLRIRQVDSVQL